MLSKWIAGGGRRYFDAVWHAVTKAQSQAEFRGDPDYKDVLEHVSEAEGRQCLAMLDDPDILGLLPGSVAADAVGNAQLYEYAGHRLSPTTLRYAKVLQDLIRIFPRFPQFKSVMEIGCGYGGQARLMSDYAAKKSCALLTYDLVDMLPVCLLAQSYLDNFRLHFSCRFMTKSQIPRDGAWDFVMSNYALSEFDFELQKEYVENAVLKSRSGYLTMNTGLDGFNPWNKDYYTIEHLISILPNAALMAEKPTTGPSNYIIVFGEHALGEGLTLDRLRSGLAPHT